MTRKTLSLKKRQPSQTKAELCDAWLHSYPVFQKHVPLAVGTGHLLKILYESIEGRPFGFIWVRRQLKNRVKKPWYKELLEQHAPRCKLDGSEVELGLDYLSGKPIPPPKL